MDYELHPYRYITGMKQAPTRFENINANRATTEYSRAIELGMTDVLRTFCDKATSHLETLIGQWSRMGRLTFDVENMVLASHGQVFGAGHPLSLPVETVFLKFADRDPQLELSEKGVFIEGCYLHEVAETDEIELTFACGEPGWATMSQAQFGDSLITVSRIAIGRVSTENTSAARRSAFIYSGLEPLLSDTALDKAMSLAVSSLPAIPPSVDSPSIPSPRIS